MPQNLPMYFAITAIIVCILLRPQIVRSTAEFEFNGCFNCQPFVGGTPFELENPRRNDILWHDDEVQRPIQLNPLPLPAGRPNNPQMLMDLNVQMTTNKRHLDVMKAEFAATNDENTGRKRARTDLGGKMEQKQPILPVEMQQMLKKRHRTQPENANAENLERKRTKSNYDTGIGNVEEDNTPITQEELVQLHRVEPMLETAELQFAVHVVEMQAQMQITMTARQHANPAKSAEPIEQKQQVRIGKPIHPAPTKRAHTAQDHVQAVHVPQQQVQFLPPVRPAQSKRAHTTQEQVQAVPAQRQQAQNGEQPNVGPAAQLNDAEWDRFLVDMRKIKQSGELRAQINQQNTYNMNGMENGRKITAGTDRSLENTYGTKRAMLMNENRTAEEQQLDKTAENIIEDPNVFQFKTIFPALRPRGSVESMRESTPSVQSVSMQDAWSEHLDSSSTASTGRSPMEIDAKISSQKISASKTAKAKHQHPQKSVYEILSQTIKRKSMSRGNKIHDVEMARRNYAIMEMITKGPLDFYKFFYLTKTKTTREKLRAIEYWWSSSARLSGTQFMQFYGKHLATSSLEKLTLLMEAWQATLGGPCRCDKNVKLQQFSNLSKIADMFFSTDQQKLGQGGTARVYRGNSEYLGSCIAIKEVPMEKLRKSLAHQYRKEVAILRILAYENYQHSIRMYKSHEKNNQLIMALELGVMDLRKLWMTHKRQFDKEFKQMEQELEKGQAHWKQETAKMLRANYPYYWERKSRLTQLMEHLFKEMLQAVAEFHQIGMHLDLKLDNFLAVPDDKHGATIHMPNGPMKVRTKLIDFGGANLINPDRYRADLPEDVRKKMVTDTTACIRHKVAFGTPNYMAPEQVECRNGDYLVSTKSDIWAMGAVLYEMFKGEAPYAVLCQRKHPKWNHWDQANDKQMEQRLKRMAEYQNCLYSMAKDPEAVHKIEYPTHTRMVQDGAHHLWYIIKATLQFNARLRPTAKGILAYLRMECRLQINGMGDLVAHHKDVPWKRCELDPKEGQMITSDPNRFNPYTRTGAKKVVGKM